MLLKLVNSNQPSFLQGHVTNVLNRQICAHLQKWIPKWHLICMVISLILPIETHYKWIAIISTLLYILQHKFFNLRRGDIVGFKKRINFIYCFIAVNLMVEHQSMRLKVQNLREITIVLSIFLLRVCELDAAKLLSVLDASHS